jgi:hypothetical protein
MTTKPLTDAGLMNHLSASGRGDYNIDPLLAFPINRMTTKLLPMLA